MPIRYAEGSAEDDAKVDHSILPHQGILSAQEPDQHPVINAFHQHIPSLGAGCQERRIYDALTELTELKMFMNTVQGQIWQKQGLKMLGENIPVTLLGTCQILSEAGFMIFSPSLKWNVSYVTGVNATKFEC